MRTGSNSKMSAFDRRNTPEQAFAVQNFWQSPAKPDQMYEEEKVQKTPAEALYMMQQDPMLNWSTQLIDLSSEKQLGGIEMVAKQALPPSFGRSSTSKNLLDFNRKVSLPTHIANRNLFSEQRANESSLINNTRVDYHGLNLPIQNINTTPDILRHKSHPKNQRRYSGFKIDDADGWSRATESLKAPPQLLQRPSNPGPAIKPGRQNQQSEHMTALQQQMDKIAIEMGLQKAPGDDLNTTNELVEAKTDSAFIRKQVTSQRDKQNAHRHPPNKSPLQLDFLAAHEEPESQSANQLEEFQKELEMLRMEAASEQYRHH